MAIACMVGYVSFRLIDEANAAPIVRFDADPGCARRAPQHAGSVCTWSRGRLAFARSDADAVEVALIRPGTPRQTVRLRRAECSSIVSFLKGPDTSVRAETFGGHVIRLETSKRTYSTLAYPEYPRTLLTTAYGTTAVLIWQSSVMVVVFAFTAGRRVRFTRRGADTP